MIKDYSQKHEVTINVTISPISNDAKGLTEHRKKVSSIEFYKRAWINDQEVFLKVEVGRSMIEDIFEQIQEIEMQTIMAESSDLPF